MTETVANDAIYREYHDKVARYIRGKIANFSDAEDLISVVFLKIYQKLEGFDETKSSLSTWIFTITRNTVTDYFRTKKVHCEFTEDITFDCDLENQLLTNEMLELLAATLEKLSERERYLIILHYYSGHTLVKIAEMMKMSYANIKIIHKKALACIKKHMNSYIIEQTKLNEE